MRRQNHSCDQCRKAKRACDAPSLREHLHRTAATAANGGGKPSGADWSGKEHLRCSYCTKTHKECTLNWALSQLEAAQVASATRPSEHRRARRPRTAPKPPASGSSTSGSGSGSRSIGRDGKPPVFPSPPDSSASTLRTTSEPGDAVGTVPMPHPSLVPAAMHQPYWGAPAVHDAFATPLPDLCPYPDMAAADPSGHHQYAGCMELPSALGFGDPSSGGGSGGNGGGGVAASHSGLVGMPFDHMPMGTAELVSRPAFHNMLPDSTVASWAVMQENAHHMGVGGCENDALVDHMTEPLADLFSADVYTSETSDEGDGASSTAGAAADLHHAARYRSASALSQHQLQHQHQHQHQQRAYPSTFAASSGALRASAAALLPPSPSTIEYIMATRVNNTSISENLLQIYHDVLEHNLTCWITEETCPYNVWARPPKKKCLAPAGGGGGGGAIGLGARGAGASSAKGGASVLAVLGGRRSWAPMPHYNAQFGPNWTNRMYHRVTKLDRAAQAAGIMRLSRAQNQASQKALHLAIMAFATQWAQASRRQAETYQEGVFSSAYGSASDEFDRQIQRHLWQQARQALQDCADVESYRVVCAELVFGLTQRPWEEDEFVELGLHDAGGGGGLNDPAGQQQQQQQNSAQAKRAAILAKLNEIHEKDGPPIFIERAARKIHTLKQKFDNYELGLLGDDHPPPESSGSSFNGNTKTRPSPEESQTVGLLFWLAAMFDTISSSMTERPVVLADDESQHEAAEHDRIFTDAGEGAAAAAETVGGGAEAEAAATKTTERSHRGSNGSIGSDNSHISHSTPHNAAAQAVAQAASSANKKALRLHEQKHNRWRIDLFIQDDPERSSYAYVRWPCAYDEAARMVTRATPVKVLLYRYVIYLQGMLRKPYAACGEPIEEILSETLLVYRYWQVTYAAFFRDLIEHHQTVPARIRGWFVCILAHWHLGALLLADVIELTDDNEVGLPAARRARRAAQTVASIRRTSAAQLADLARIATPFVLAADGSGGVAAPEPQMPNFHFAVREGTVLTEPWTILLIRSFSRAALLHLQDVDAMRLQHQTTADLLGHHEEACRESLRRCEECIQALWYLGKKSDMARNVAAVLFKAMHV